MKTVRFFLAAVLAVFFAACSSKPALPSAEEALESYRAQMDELDATLQACSSQAEADSLMQTFFASSLELAQQYAGTEVPIVVMRDIIYYLSTDEKKLLFDAICLDSLNEHDLRYYDAFQAELLTAPGKSFVDFGALTPAGDSLYLHQLVGSKPYLLIDFWATWCGPCRASMPALKELYAEASDRLEILGVSLDADGDKWRSFLTDPATALPWKHISDLQGWACYPASLYGVCSIPATVLLDSTGTIIARNLEPDALRTIVLE